MFEFQNDNKRVKHFNIQGHARLLTFSCYRGTKLLANPDTLALLSRRIDWATSHHNIRLVAFVYMPEHTHLLVWPELESCLIEKFLYAVKKPFSDAVKRSLQDSKDPLLQELTIEERPGKTTFRFWQEGPGHDRNIASMQGAIKAAEYIHNNPVRRGLCASPDQWRWSSWRYYFQPHLAADPDLPKIHGFPP